MGVECAYVDLEVAFDVQALMKVLSAPVAGIVPILGAGEAFTRFRMLALLPPLFPGVTLSFLNEGLTPLHVRAMHYM